MKDKKIFRTSPSKAFAVIALMSVPAVVLADYFDDLEVQQYTRIGVYGSGSDTLDLLVWVADCRVQ